MTQGHILGTSLDIDAVRKIAGKIGFSDGNLPEHKSVGGLRLQIHAPCYLEGVEGVVTEIEFDDMTDSFPDNAEALEVLSQLYQGIPDLQYLKGYGVGQQCVGSASELVS